MSEESTDFSKYNIEDLLLNEVSAHNINNEVTVFRSFGFLLIQILLYLNRAQSSETPRRLREAGSLLRRTMTRNLMPKDLRTGLNEQRTSIPSPRVLVLKASGRTKMDLATGDAAESRSTLRARDTRVTGKIPRRNAAFIEFTFFSMKKIPEYLPKDSKRLTCLESMLIL